MRSRLVIACLAGVAALNGAATASAAGRIKAAFVEQGIPSRPFTDSAVMLDNNIVTPGPNTGIPGITSMTFTNFSAVAQEVFVFAAIMPAGRECGGPILATTDPHQHVLVQPRSTLQLTFPTPWLISTPGSATCVGAQTASDLAGGQVEIDFNALVNGFTASRTPR